MKFYKLLMLACTFFATSAFATQNAVYCPDPATNESGGEIIFQGKSISSNASSLHWIGENQADKPWFEYRRNNAERYIDVSIEAIPVSPNVTQLKCSYDVSYKPGEYPPAWGRGGSVSTLVTGNYKLANNMQSCGYNVGWINECHFVSGD